MFSQEEKKMLVGIARKSLDSYVRSSRILSFDGKKYPAISDLWFGRNQNIAKAKRALTDAINGFLANRYCMTLLNMIQEGYLKVLELEQTDSQQV